MAVPVITVDGPSGVGKGTICLKLAEKTGWHLLDSGSLYRLTALQSIRNNITNDSQAIDIARELSVEYTADSGRLTIHLAGDDVTEAIREEQVGNEASRLAAIPEVRQALLQRQRDFAVSPGLIADGRDMGTVVFPTAELKIFLTASAEERAKRRYKQLIGKGIGANLSDLAAELEERDRRDMNRKHSPLVAADDAISIDTTSLSIEQVTDKVMGLVNERFADPLD